DLSVARRGGARQNATRKPLGIFIRFTRVMLAQGPARADQPGRVIARRRLASIASPIDASTCGGTTVSTVMHMMASRASVLRLMFIVVMLMLWLFRIVFIFLMMLGWFW